MPDSTRTVLYLTVDTEYSFGMARDGASREECFARSISCETEEGAVGVGYQINRLDRHGLKGVFFVDPMPALVWGTAAIEDVVSLILAAGHEVQLHCHTEWLEIAGTANPLGTRTAAQLNQLALSEQQDLLGWAREALVAAGAPAPTAFRAGNYGASDDTLRALAAIGVTYDTSFTPGITGGDCAITLPRESFAPVRHCGTIEVPVGAIATPGGGLRHAQLTALTGAEILAALRHAARHGAGSLTLVSHSFELLSRDRTRINQLLRRRFEKLCAALAATPGASTATYQSHPPQLAEAAGGAVVPLPPSLWRTGARLAEQALGNALYGRR